MGQISSVCSRTGASLPTSVPRGFVKKTSNRYELSAGGAKKAGKYAYEHPYVRADGATVGVFSCDPVGDDAVGSADLLERPGDAEMREIAVVSGEIMADIQRADNADAYFVLPSQLNGAEYPSERTVVTAIQDYVHDNTGGPRGQLAVHPAPGQFVLDNAASSRNPDGINAVDQILEAMPPGSGFELVNGYLKLPTPSSKAEADELLAAFRSKLHTLRPLIMSGIPATGLAPSKRAFSQVTHSVGLVYASAVPVGSYMNREPPGTVAGDFHVKCAESVLVAQYYGSLKQIAEKAKSGQGKTRVYLLPLGGGVFNNPVPSIVKAMSLAVELLGDRCLLGYLDIRVLAWSGNHLEEPDLKRELERTRKLRG